MSGHVLFVMYQQKQAYFDDDAGDPQIEISERANLRLARALNVTVSHRECRIGDRAEEIRLLLEVRIGPSRQTRNASQHPIPTRKLCSTSTETSRGTNCTNKLFTISFLIRAIQIIRDTLCERVVQVTSNREEGVNQSGT